MALDLPATSLPPIVLRGAPGAERVLTAEALAFVAELEARFSLRLTALMVARARRQERIDRGELPDYLPQTLDIRRGIWEVPPLPRILADRRVEIAGPVERGAMIAALTSGARAYMADFEDATAPSFPNLIAGHANLIDHRDGALEGGSPTEGPLLMVRPRGLHLSEANLLIGGQPVSAALFDFGLNVFHCGRALAEAGRGPFYYLPKLESQDEARLWNDLFLFAQERLGLPRGSIKATVLVETLPAVFEMDEIVWQLREHIAGLACGHRDYIFSYIKTLRAHGAYLLPEREQLSMRRAFLATYVARLVKVCHRRGIHAIGDISAAAPVAGDAAAGARLRGEVLHEVGMGYDGTRVTHPALVPLAAEVFEAEVAGLNQLRRQQQHYRIEPAMLLKPHEGAVSEAGLRRTLALAIECLAQWLQGHGAVTAGGQIEDIATAELCRAQLWHWRRHGATVELEAGGARRLSAEWLGTLVQAEIAAILDRLGPTGFHRGRYASAARMVQEAATAEALPDFITAPAYDVLNALD